MSAALSREAWSGGPDAIPSRIGTAIGGKYVLLERIGAGGVGVVYRAAQPALSRSVAIKLLHRALANDPDSVRRFRDEAIAATRFAHPNSVMVIDSGTTEDGTPFIVMEHVRGETLRAVLARAGSLPVPRVVNIALQILAGLGEAHRAAVVHADIKTDNVLVEPNRDGGERIKIVDFGLAALARVPAELGDLRGAETVSGTPEYMAPEVVRGDAVTASADLYAVGVVVYELLTGNTPFGGGTANDVMQRHLRDDVVLPSLRRPDLALPAEIETVVLRALAKDPAARFPDAEAFAAALRRVPVIEAASGLGRCPACGDDISTGRFCSGCGASAGVIAAGRSHATTQVGRRAPKRLAAARPDPSLAYGAARISAPTIRQIRGLRDDVGVAIVNGDLDAIAAGYSALARALVDGQQLASAIRELKEGLAVLAGTAERGTDRGPARMLAGALVALEEALRKRRKPAVRGR